MSDSIRYTESTWNELQLSFTVYAMVHTDKCIRRSSCAYKCRRDVGVNTRIYHLLDTQEDQRDVPKFRLDTWPQLPSLW